MDGIKRVITNKKLSDLIFSKNTQAQFLKNIKSLRKLISKNPKKIKDGPGLLREIKSLYIKMYPYYVLALFVAGPWRDEFIRIHGKKAKKILDQEFKLRVASEGLLKEVTNFMRA